MVDCPIDGWKNIETSNCPQCNTDLSSIHRIKELPDSYFNRALDLANAQDHAGAIGCILTALSLRPGDSAYQLLLCKLYMLNAQYPEAAAELDRFLVANPQNVEALELKRQADDELKRISNAQKQPEEKPVPAEIKTEAPVKSNAFFRVAAYTAPIAAFFVGMLVYSLFQHSPKLSSDAAVGKLYAAIKSDSMLNGYKVNFNYNGKGITVNSQLPSEMHRRLLLSETRNAIDNQFEIYDSTTVKFVPPMLYHYVQAGDKLWVLSERYYNTCRYWTVIYEANKDVIRNPARLTIGQKLHIPDKK